MTTSPSERPNPSAKEPLAGARGWRLFRIGGVDVQADPSLALIFMLISFNLGAGVIPRYHPDWRPFTVWATALTAAVLFFASLLAHELAHALVARRSGMVVRRISLYLFGGMAHLESDVPSPRVEFWMAVVGPLTSFAIGAFSALLGIHLAGSGLVDAVNSDATLSIERALAETTPLVTLLLWLGPVNLLLGAFNLLPGFPMDGGRIVRSLLWWATGDLLKATRWASVAGRLVAFGLMLVGVLDLLAGNVIQGFWLLLLGLLLNAAARATYGDLVLRQSLSQVSVGSLMRTQFDRVEPHLTLEDFVHDHAMTTDQQTFPVEEGETLLGVISIEQARQIPKAHWRSTSVCDAMVPRRRLATLEPEVEGRQALAELANPNVELPVVRGDHLLGLVRRSDLLKWLSLHQPLSPT